MIIEKKALTMTEAYEIVKSLEEKSPVQDYFKKFSKLNVEKAKKLIEEIGGLNNAKIKEEQVIKIVDFLPDEKGELARIFNDTGLTEYETNAILETVKKYK